MCYISECPQCGKKETHNNKRCMRYVCEDQEVVSKTCSDCREDKPIVFDDHYDGESVYVGVLSNGDVFPIRDRK